MILVIIDMDFYIFKGLTKSTRLNS